VTLPLEAAYGVLLAGAGGLAYAVRGPRCGWLAPSLWHGPRDRKAIALTFDDGPSESTPQLLDLLDTYGARATFFQIGRHVERLPDIAREVVRRGHEIGNHTYSHAPLYLRHPQFVRDEVAAGQEAIRTVAGVEARWFRAPYGARWFGLRHAQKEFGLVGVMWSTLALDWKMDLSTVCGKLQSDVRQGAIWCLHDGRELEVQPEIDRTLDAVRRLLPSLRDKGYRSVTVSDLLLPLAVD
jgi:peptidoglycan/xylan/chitin deacetylase (PgdA/CDA1 family)